ncbi:methionine ABC transporter permease [Enterococcus xiangfangensis]|uniref:ABC transporter permease n=1 Tax=Enterococcus xiangfangensis TaxID=1296537 RepID=A0ABU3F7T9_9ENTE|nr:methionine ABC transporter permease [Enterococcus xiangfangensis]MBM7712695.1 D-methionine transport system permease protein [Enterococcus xiangfangensis]MDT2758727.1 ABC transporter permease [Enterococcus xiangfangensis]NBK09836.1 ABC transporter permease [Enterococcus asini]
MSNLFPHVLTMQGAIWQATLETVYMTIASAVIAGVIGLLTGLLLVVTQPGGIIQDRSFYSVLDKVVNLLRSVPFIILLAVISPLTSFLVGTTVGTTAALVPLVMGIFPFYARQIQNALQEVGQGVIEAAQSMGLSNWEIIFRVYLREGLADIIRVSTLTVISLIGLTTMAGAVGAGGLGNVAISIGYARFQNDVTFVCMIILLIMVFVIQFIGDRLASRFTKF